MYFENKRSNAKVSAQSDIRTACYMHINL